MVEICIVFFVGIVEVVEYINLYLKEFNLLGMMICFFKMIFECFILLCFIFLLLNLGLNIELF